MKIILIDGFSNYVTKAHLISNISKKISKIIFGRTTQDYMNKFEKYLNDKGYETEQHKWSKSIKLKEIREEAKKLHRELKKEENILIVAKSNGGLLAQYALLGLNHKLIQIATPNIQTKTDLHIINIYSNTDKIQKAGIKYYELLTGHVGSRKMYGKHIRNISMDGLDYNDFGKEKYYPIYEDIIKKVINN